VHVTRGLLAVVVLVVVACGEDGSGHPTELDVSMFNTYFEPTDETFQIGVPIEIMVTNAAPEGAQLSVHDFTVLAGLYETEADVQQALRNDPGLLVATTELMAPGDSKTLNVTFEQAGVYQFVCTVPDHLGAGMTGTITVQG